MRGPSSFALVIPLVTFFTRSALAECTKDIECKGERVCVEGACVDPPARVPAPASSPTAALPEAPGAEAIPDNPPRPKTPEAPRMVRRSDALFFGGIAALGLAPVGLVVAVANVLAKDNCQTDGEGAMPASVAYPVGSPRPKCTSYDGIILGSLATSFVLGGGGLAMLLVGGEKVPAAKEAAQIRPWFSPTTAGLSLQTTF